METSTTEKVTITSIIDVQDNQAQLPTSYAMLQNYPNPFNPNTTIAFTLPEPAAVTMKLYDLRGREVKSIINSNMQAGEYNVQINAAALSERKEAQEILQSSAADRDRAERLLDQIEGTE